MTETVLTPRQQRERDFFDEHSALYEELAEVNFDAIAGLEHRPWNPYWFVLETAKQLYSAGERTLLDAGCGEGIYATLFAAIGFKVAGFDISPKSVEISRRLATANGFSGSTRFSVQAAEHLNYPDDSFDVVVGVDILHHVEVVPSVAELLRVLRPGGILPERKTPGCLLIHHRRRTQADRLRHRKHSGTLSGTEGDAL